MLKKIKEAAEARCDQRATLRDFEASIPPPILAIWREGIEEWERDSSAPNPYRSNGEGMSCH